MQNFFNDTQEVLKITERILERAILANQTALIEHEYFFEMTSYTPFEEAENLFISSDDPDCEFDNEEIQEPLEWWLVSKWLHDHLTTLGFVTLQTDWGYYWGRTTSGQAIELDGVIQEVARSICVEDL